MANKSKYILGGAASGAAAGAPLGPWGIAGGAILGGILGASQAPDDVKKQKMLDQAIIDKLANQALGNEATASELNMRQAFDKTLAQQIAAARTQSRGVNPALQSRTIARLASERTADAAAEGAKLAVQERAASFDKYMKAIQYNNSVLEANNAAEAGQEKQANMALANGLNAGVSAASNYAVKRDTETQMAKDAAAKTTAAAPAPIVAPAAESVGAAQAQNAAYSLGANQVAAAPTQSFNMNPRLGQVAMAGDMQTSDIKAKKAVMSERYLTSDERQKDLIKSEDLPQNMNLQMQNQQAAQPNGAEPTGSPLAQNQPSVQIPQQQQTGVSGKVQNALPAPQTPVAQQIPDNSNLMVSSDMIERARKSMRQGGNVRDIQNDTSQLGAAPVVALTPEKDAEFRAWATQEAARQDTAANRVGGKNKSAAELYQDQVNKYNTSQSEKFADYQKNKDQVDAINKAKSLERSARLANFYTGNSTTSAADVAQGYANKKIYGGQAPVSDSKQGASLQDYVDTALQGLGAIPNPISIQAQILDNARKSWEQDNGDVGNFIKDPVKSIGNLFSDETAKMGVKSEGKNAPNMNPKSFLDKLHAYSFEYKDNVKNMPGAGEGRKLGVMAQEVEKAGPVGKQMVKEDPATGMKQLDTVSGFGAVLASQVQLNERLKILEQKYGKKKKEA